jgi:hypothetical protein
MKRMYVLDEEIQVHIMNVFETIMQQEKKLLLNAAN